MNYLEGKNIKLRALEPEDLELLYTWENDGSVWQVSNTISPYSRFVLKQYLQSSHQDIYEHKQLRLVITVKEAIEKPEIGFIDLFDFDPFHLRAGIGILIADKEARNKGYAKESLSLLVNYSFEKLGLNQLYCNITRNNERSLHLFQRLGFIITGEKKQWIKTPSGFLDEYILQLIRPDYYPN